MIKQALQIWNADDINSALLEVILFFNNIL